MPELNDILSFWFKDINDQTLIKKKEEPFRLWFNSDKQFDTSIKENYAQAINEAQSGKLRVWEDWIEGKLALVLLFDQFARNVYRNTPKMYENDGEAVRLSKEAIEKKEDVHLMLIQRLFLFMPLQHAEDKPTQELSLNCAMQLVDDAKHVNPSNVEYYEYHLKYAKKHKDIIDQFGRFPHRNKILNRESTADEIEFLNQS